MSIVTWPHEVSKFVRMREEAWHIWRRNANLKEIGAKSWDAADKKKIGGELITAKRRTKNTI